MVHTMARVEVADFDLWLRVHRANAENRARVRHHRRSHLPRHRRAERHSCSHLHRRSFPSRPVVPDRSIQGSNPRLGSAAPYVLSRDRGRTLIELHSQTLRPRTRSLICLVHRLHRVPTWLPRCAGQPAFMAARAIEELKRRSGCLHFSSLASGLPW
jgi:hypothetical protein